MSERDDLITNLRQVLELERGMGVDFVAKALEERKSGGAEERKIELPAAPVISVARALREAATVPVQSSDTLTSIAAQIAACRACGLCASRTNTVPGEGNPAAPLVFVGEGPGADEDAQGRPFVGAAGQLLDKMIVAMGLTRAEVFIVNVLKCRPPGNRTPEPAEVTACLGFLERQLTLIKPQVICTLGNTPLRALMNDPALGITKMHGQHLTWRGTTVIPTFHPAFLLRNAQAKKPCWDDLKLVVTALGRTLPSRAS